tara:strand:+ start:107 stop:1393 length:1287 start_codon:yes stop_codon:yes gene_type:complete
MSKSDIRGKEVLILGGGISGLSAGWILKRLGAQVTIVEMNDHLGGIGRTHTLNGKKYEFGPHILHADKDHTISFYEQYGTREIEYYAKMAHGDSFDNLIDFPYSVDSVFQLPKALGRKVVKELFESKNIKIDHSNLEKYLRSVVGDTLYDEFNAGYSRKFWGKDPKEIPANGAASWISLRTDDKRLFTTWQAYPKGDYNQFMEWVGKDIPRIRAKVVGLNKGKSKINSVITDQSEISADIYISTIPLKSCFPKMPTELSYAGNVLVAIKLKDGPVFPSGVGGIYYPGSKYKFKRVCEYPSMTEKDYPNLTGGTLIGFEYNTFPWEEKSYSEDFYIEDSVKACREILNLEPEALKFHSHDDIYPIRDEIQMRAYSNIEKEVSQYENFFLNGRYGNFVYTNMNDCFEMSFDLVQNLASMDEKILRSEIGL